MKLFVTFVAILVLGLSLIPCCTPVTAAIVQKTVNVASDCCQKESCKETDDMQDEGCNSCSPFFSCGSCSGFIFHPTSSLLADLNPPSAIAYHSFDIQFNSEYFASKWQPPKIS